MHRSRLIPAFWDLAAMVAEAGRRQARAELTACCCASGCSLRLFSSLSSATLSRASSSRTRRASRSTTSTSGSTRGRVRAGSTPSETDETKRVQKGRGPEDAGAHGQAQGPGRSRALPAAARTSPGSTRSRATCAEKVRRILHHAHAAGVRQREGRLFGRAEEGALRAQRDRAAGCRRPIAKSPPPTGASPTSTTSWRVSRTRRRASTPQPRSTRRAVLSEFQVSLRQMAKMCVGRQGNHFPILSES